MILARIERKPVSVIGNMSRGWQSAGPDDALDASRRTVEFKFEIEDAGSGFLLLCVSSDGSLYCDRWYVSIEDLHSDAESDFGIHPEEWTEPESLSLDPGGT